MKTKIVLLLLGILITLLFPLLLFQMQDNIDMHSTKYESSEDFHEITETYPIISAIYSDAYENHSDYLLEEYDISALHTYDSALQEELTKRKDAFEQQIHALLEYKVLSDTNFPMEEAPYTINYGKLSFSLDSSFTTNLQQVVSMEYPYVHSQYFTYTTQADKITSIYLSNALLKELSEEDCKKIAWSMVQYLGLEDIKDWNYLNYGYESYQAKLQVYCEKVANVDGYASLRIGVLPISLNLSPNLG